MSASGWFGARTLVWLLVAVVASGSVLLVGYDEDAERHADSLGWIGTAARTVHATTTAWLVVGALVHVGVRLRRSATVAGLRTGAVLWAALGLALVSGWAISQTWVQDKILATLRVSPAVVGVVHVAYTSILVTIALALHITRWGWRRILAPGRPLAGASLLVAAGALLPVAPPGDRTPWHGVTAWTAVPVAGGWAWPLVLAALLGWAALAWPRR